MEAQIEESNSARYFESKPALTAEQVQSQLKKSDLQLSRRRVLQQLEHSTDERYCELLRRTLADLDLQIRAL